MRKLILGILAGMLVGGVAYASASGGPALHGPTIQVSQSEMLPGPPTLAENGGEPSQIEDVEIAKCPRGYYATGGGYVARSSVGGSLPLGAVITQNEPVDTTNIQGTTNNPGPHPNGWVIRIFNTNEFGSFSINIHVSAICVGA